MLTAIGFFCTLEAFATLVRSILSFLMILHQFIVRLKGIQVDNLEIQVGNRFVVLFGNISLEVGERMNRSIGWNHDIWSIQKELHEILLVNLFYCSIFCLQVDTHLKSNFSV